MPMVATVAFLLITLGVGIFFLIQFFGGSKEVQNAVDGGTLQVAKRALWAPRVQLTHSNPVTGLDEIIEFSGVAKKVKEIELANFSGSVPPDDGNFYIDLQGINGVWGLALLEALNVQKMQQNGLATPLAVTHARQLQQTAADISKRLAQGLTSDTDATQAEPGVNNPLHKKFHQLANVNTVRMLNWQTGEAIREDDYHNSYTYRLKDSNIQYNVDQTTISLLALNNINTQPLNGKFLRGYAPCTVPLSGQPLDFMFVPLDHDKKPHLLSETRYGPDKDCRTIQSPLTQAVPPEIPPNAFHFSALAKVEKATKDMELRAFAVSQDMTPGLILQNARGFIRIENQPGVGSSNSLHVLELANQQVVDGYRANQGLLPDEAGVVLGNSLFNPVQNDYSRNNYASSAGAIMTIACIAAAILGIHIPCLWCFFLLIGAMICYIGCCLMALITIFAIQCDVPTFFTGSFMNPLNPGFKPVYSYFPGLSSPGTAIAPYGVSSGGLCNVTPENAGHPEHKIFWDWLEGDYSADVGALVLSFLFAPPAICGWADLLHGGGISAHPHLQFDADNYESGMKDRIQPGGRTFSLLNRQVAPANFTSVGSLRTLLFNRIATDSSGNVKRVYDILYQRIQEINPPAPNATPQELAAHASAIQQILSSPKPIPLGAHAFIYLDDNNVLQLSVPSTGDQLPSWLQTVRNEQPDGSDYHGNIPTQFEYRDQDEKNRCYRVANPSQDFNPAPAVFAPTSDNYPTRVCSYDLYHFFPSSGYHGLFGVLKLGSKIERKCMRQGTINSASPPWSQPDDCFCPTRPNGSKQQGNCDPGVL